MNQEAMNRQLVVVVGSNTVEASLELVLRPMGFSVVAWQEGIEPACEALAPRLVVAHLPGSDPAEVLAKLAAVRAALPNVAVIAMTDTAEPSLRAELQAAGAADSLVYPVETSELRARVAELAGRLSGFWSLSTSGVDFALDEAGFVLRLDSVEAHLTKSEFAIMAYLVAHREQWISAQDLLRDVLGPNHAAGTSLVRVHMHNIRRKLGIRGRAIQVVRGRGYRLAPDAVGCEAAPGLMTA